MRHQMAAAEMQQCIEDCGDCASTCAQTSHHCLHMGGEHAAPEHQGILRDCAQLCGVAVGFMARSSPRAAEICRMCAETCIECAADCDRLANGDPTMQRCAEVCRQCAKSCEHMASAGV